MEQDTTAAMPVMDGNKQKNEKGWKIATIVASVVAVCGIGFGVYGVSQISDLKAQVDDANKTIDSLNASLNSIHSGDGNIDNQLVDNSANLDFDFDELLSTLNYSTQQGGKTTFISKCQEKNTGEGELPETEYNSINVSGDTIESVVSKLKSASSVEKTTYSWFGCPPKSIEYVVGVASNDSETIQQQKVFSMNYADSGKILLVGYNNEGYAFTFDSSDGVDGFIESLK